MTLTTHCLIISPVQNKWISGHFCIYERNESYFRLLFEDKEFRNGLVPAFFPAFLWGPSLTSSIYCHLPIMLIGLNHS